MHVGKSCFTTISTFMNNLMLQMLKLFLTLDPRLSFLTIAVARGTEFEMRDESALLKIVIGKGVFL